MRDVGRLVKKLSGWLGYRMCRLPVHRSARLWALAVWLVTRPWSSAKRRAFFYVVQTPGLLRELLEADRDTSERLFDGIVEMAEAPGG